MNENLIDLCINKVGNKFVFVLLVIFRIKQLMKGEKPLLSDNFSNNYFLITLNEILCNKLKVKFKDVITSKENIKDKYNVLKK